MLEKVCWILSLAMFFIEMVAGRLCGSSALLGDSLRFFSEASERFRGKARLSLFRGSIWASPCIAIHFARPFVEHAHST